MLSFQTERLFKSKYKVWRGQFGFSRQANYRYAEWKVDIPQQPPLNRQQTDQRIVEPVRQNDMRSLWLDRFLENILNEPHCKDWKEQESDKEAQSLYFKSDARQFVAKLVGSVASAMMKSLIVLAPQKTVSRNRYDQQSARSQSSIELVHRGQIVISVFQHVQRCDQIKTAVNKRKSLYS